MKNKRASAQALISILDVKHLIIIQKIFLKCIDNYHNF